VNTKRKWDRGSVVFQEGVSPLGKLVEVRPARVVEDSDRELRLSFAAGSTYLSGDWMRGRRRYELSLAQRIREFSSTEPLTFEERTNRSRNTLSVLPREALHAVWFFWDRDWNPSEAFVNFQAPYTRVDDRLQVIDYYLDLQLTSALEWSRKDEDEFDAMHEAGVLSDELVSQVRDEAQAVIRRIEARVWPFDGSLWEWRPPAGWGGLNLEGYDLRDEGRR